MKRSGFTMIELIFVIVILGILAAVAIPRMTGVQDDAKISAELGTIGAVRGGLTLLNGKYLVESSKAGFDRTKVNIGGGVTTEFGPEGYPTSLTTNTGGKTHVFANVLDQAPDANWKRSVEVYTGPANGLTQTSEDGTIKDKKNDGWSYDGKGVISLQLK